MNSSFITSGPGPEVLKFFSCSAQLSMHFILLINVKMSAIVYLSVSCSLAITCWERADLLALLCVVFSYVFVTFPYSVSDQVW